MTRRISHQDLGSRFRNPTVRAGSRFQNLTVRAGSRFRNPTVRASSAGPLKRETILSDERTHAQTHTHIVIIYKIG